MKKVAIGLAGGPTAVLNTSLVGFLNNLNAEIYVVFEGYQGLVNGNLVLLKKEQTEKINQFRNIPGACLGAGRYQMDSDDLLKAIDRLKEKRIETLVFIGGNGTMWTLYQLGEVAREIGYRLQIIGIPKTVDNDLYGTDHSPGFGSAARYIAISVRDISKDLEAMRNFEQVRIIETMGRNVGWLAATSGLLKVNESDGPHKIYFPERKFSIDEFLEDVKNIYNDLGCVSIVISEGVKLDEQTVIKKGVVNGRRVLGRIAYQLSSIVQQELGIIARDEVLGMNQRCCQLLSSSQDRIEAYEVGRQGAKLVDADISNVMVSIQRQNLSHYNYKLGTVPLDIVVSGGERQLPSKFVKNLQLYNSWLRPLVGSDIEPFPPTILRRENDEKNAFRLQ